ncbi:unnamed protein product [Pleuronectes platessa]|uniref:Uncharacterized protein n=1 Tax=Pleuronectes platessa TaxID=8262 RepID=A0A9N7Z492_PLEPL|nr:unnamed protein product [Pleuronectes platessa]
MSHLQGGTFNKNSLYVKSCKDLMDICQDQSSEDGGHGDQVILQMSLNEVSSISTASPAKEGSNRPEDSQAKVRRSERLAAARKGTSGKTGPDRCKRMRDGHDPTSNGNPSTKKKHMGNRREASQAKVRRSERLAAIRKIRSGKTGPNRQKRMREREDSVGQNRFMGRRRIELAL